MVESYSGSFPFISLLKLLNYNVTWWIGEKEDWKKSFKFEAKFKVGYSLSLPLFEDFDLQFTSFLHLRLSHSFEQLKSYYLTLNLLIPINWDAFLTKTPFPWGLLNEHQNMFLEFRAKSHSCEKQILYPFLFFAQLSNSEF